MKKTDTVTGRIWELMCDGKYRTLEQIREITGASRFGVGQQLRHLRTAKFGKHMIHCRRQSKMKWAPTEHRLIVNLNHPSPSRYDGEPRYDIPQETDAACSNLTFPATSTQ